MLSLWILQIQSDYFHLHRSCLLRNLMSHLLHKLHLSLHHNIEILLFLRWLHCCRSSAGKLYDQNTEYNQILNRLPGWQFLGIHHLQSNPAFQSLYLLPLHPVQLFPRPSNCIHNLHNYMTSLGFHGFPLHPDHKNHCRLIGQDRPLLRSDHLPHLLLVAYYLKQLPEIPLYCHLSYNFLSTSL